jgi:hypothetical protein
MLRFDLDRGLKAPRNWVSPVNGAGGENVWARAVPAINRGATRQSPVNGAGEKV